MRGEESGGVADGGPGGGGGSAFRPLLAVLGDDNPGEGDGAQRRGELIYVFTNRWVSTDRQTKLTCIQ